MTTLIDPEISHESVKELVATGRYMKHRLEASLYLLKKHRDAVKRDRALDGLDYSSTVDLIVLLEDFQDRMSRLERKTYPEDFVKQKSSIPTTSDLDRAGAALTEPARAGVA